MTVQWRVQHIFKEKNKIAKYLAKMTRSKENDFKLFEQPPNGMLV